MADYLTDEEARQMGLDPRGPAAGDYLTDEEVRIAGLDPDGPSRTAPLPIEGYRAGATSQGLPMEPGNALKPLGAFRGAIGRLRQGLTLGSGAQFAGAGDTALQSLFGDSPAVRTLTGGPAPVGDLMERYRQNRDRERAIEAINAESYPWTGGIAEVAGAALVPVPAGKGLGKMMLGMGAVGALEGAGRSGGDLTKGEVGEVGGDALATGAGYAVGAGVLGALPRGASWLGKKAGSRLRTIGQDIGAAASRKFNKRMGQIGKEASSATGGVENAHIAQEVYEDINQTILRRAINPAARPRPIETLPGGLPYAEQLMRQRVANAQKAIGKYKDNPLVPRNKQRLVDAGWRLQAMNANQRMASGGRRAAIGAVGSAAITAAGHPFLAGAFGGTVGMYYGVREVVRGAMMRPDILRRLTGLEKWGAVIGQAVAKGEQAATPVLLALYQKEPGVRAEMDAIMRESPGTGE